MKKVLLSLAVAAASLTASAQNTVLVNETFEDNTAIGFAYNWNNQTDFALPSFLIVSSQW